MAKVGSSGKEGQEWGREENVCGGKGCHGRAGLMPASELKGVWEVAQLVKLNGIELKCWKTTYC